MTGSRKLCAAFLMLVALSVAHADEQVLWWRIFGEEDVDWYGSNISVSQLAAMKDNQLLAKVSVRDSSGASVRYLDLYTVEDGEVVPPVDAPIDSMYVPPANVFADLDGYGAGYSFAIELGNEIAGNWVAYVVSEVRSYNSLYDDHNITNWKPGREPVRQGEWVPRSFHIPEPCSGLLLLVGGGLLALRRRRNV